MPEIPTIVSNSFEWFIQENCDKRNILSGVFLKILSFKAKSILKESDWR